MTEFLLNSKSSIFFSVKECVYDGENPRERIMQYTHSTITNMVSVWKTYFLIPFTDPFYNSWGKEGHYYKTFFQKRWDTWENYTNKNSSSEAKELNLLQQNTVSALCKKNIMKCMYAVFVPSSQKEILKATLVSHLDSHSTL